MLEYFLWTDLHKNECVGKPWMSTFQNTQNFDQTPTELGVILILVQHTLRKIGKMSKKSLISTCLKSNYTEYLKEVVEMVTPMVGCLHSLHQLEILLRPHLSSRFFLSWSFSAAIWSWASYRGIGMFSYNVYYRLRHSEDRNSVWKGPHSTSTLTMQGGPPLHRCVTISTTSFKEW